MVNFIAINLVRWLKEVTGKLFADKGCIFESRSMGCKQEDFI